MTNPLKNSTGANTLRLLVAALIVLAFFGRAAAQTPGGTVKRVAAPVSMYTDIRYEWSDPLAQGGKLTASYKLRVK